MRRELEFDGSVAQERDLIQSKSLKNTFKNWEKFLKKLSLNSKKIFKSDYNIL